MNFKSGKIWSVFFISLTLLVALYLGFSPHGLFNREGSKEDGHSGPSVTKGNQGTHEDQGQGGKNYNFALGLTKQYQFELMSDSFSDFSGMMNKENSNNGIGDTNNTSSTLDQKIRYQLKGRWQTSVVQMDAKSMLLKGQFLEVQLDWNRSLLASNETQLEEQRQQIQQELTRPFFFEMDGEGRILSLLLSKRDPTKNENQITENLIKSFLSTTQVIFKKDLFLSENEEGLEWQVEEEDLNGLYLTEYILLSKDSNSNSNSSSTTLFELGKQRLAYLQNTPARASSSRGKIQRSPLQKTALKFRPEESSWQIHFDPQKGHVDRIQGSEREEILLGGEVIGINQKKLVLAFEKEFVLESLGLKQETDLLKDLALQGKITHLGLEWNQMEFEESIARTELGRMGAKELFSLINQYIKAGDDDKIDGLYLKFKALLALYPESAQEVAALLHHLPARSKAFQILSLALGTVGSAECQKALINVIEFRQEDGGAQTHLISELGMVAQPIPESVEFLKKTIQTSKNPDVISSSGLALGIMAGHLLEHNSSLSDDIVSGVIKDYQNSPDAQHKAYLLSVLGNSGSPLAKGVIEEAMTSTDKLVRAEAMNALRWVPGEESDLWLKRGLDDPEEDVRAASVFALGMRSPTEEHFQWLKEKYKKESSFSVKKEMVKSAWNYRQGMQDQDIPLSQEIEDWVKEIKESQQEDEDLKKLAQSFLMAK